MITGRLEGIGKAMKHTRAAMMNGGGLTVHDGAGVNDATTEGLADGLMPEAYAQDRDLSAEMLNDVHRYPGLVRGAGPGRDDDVLRAERRDLRKPDPIVAEDPHIRA